MLDAPARRILAAPLDATAAALARTPISPLALTAAGWIVGVGACVSIARGATWLALGLWLLNRLLDGLDGPLARRRRGASELGGFLDIVADFSIYAGFVLGVAVGRPDARIACLVLLTAYYVSGTAFLALSSLLEKLGTSAEETAADGRSLRFVGGLAEGTETILVYIAFCLFATRSELIAWIFAGAVTITALQRIVLGVHVLRTHQPVRSHQENR